MNDDDDYLDDGPAGDSIDELIQLLGLQQGLLTAVATGGPQMKTVDPLYKRRRAKLRRGLAALDIEDPFPWTGLWEWYGVWGSYGGYAGRRAHLEELAGPVRDELEAKRDATGVADWGEENIDGIEHRLVELKRRLEGARSLDDYQDIGRRAREILIALGRLIFDEGMVPSGQAVPGPSDAKARLDLYFEQRFPGKANEEMRRFMKAAAALANSVTHSNDTADVHAFAVAQATVLVVRVAAKLERQPGPEADGDLSWLS
jgi:hypothetical protein